MTHSLLKSLYVVVPFLIYGCVTDGSHLDEPADACVVSSLMLNRDGRSGVQFTNDCRTCIAVAFEYDAGRKSRATSACYVPAETRVVYWGATGYRIMKQEDCEEAQQDALKPLASGAELDANVRNGKCDLLGVFAD